MEFLTDARVLLTLLFGLPAALWLQWTKSRETSWMLRSKRMEAARALFKDAAWKKAAPLDFHFAMRDAFGRSVEQCELHFIEGRQDPARLLLNRIAAGNSLRFLPSERRYVDARKAPWVSFDFVSTATVAVAAIVVPLSGIAGVWGWQSENHLLMALAILYGIATFVTAVHLSLRADFARWVLAGEGHEPVELLVGDSDGARSSGERTSTPVSENSAAGHVAEAEEHTDAAVLQPVA